MRDLCYTDAVELARLIRQREVSVTEVFEAHLERITRFNPLINTIITLDEENARRKAGEADALLAKDQAAGDLFGVPYTIKDMFDTAGVRSTCGFLPFKERIAEKDSNVAARLKAAGGILLGKTNVRLFPDNPFGVTNNPWDLQRSIGGSSNGAGAVAAGMSPLDIGNDTGGSILGPANDCGIYGMRPTEHRVSVAGYTIPEPINVWRVMSVAGPLTRSVADLRLALKILVGPDNRDHDVPPVKWQDATVELTKLRLAWTTFPGAKIMREIIQAVEGFAGRLAGAGFSIEQAAPEVDFVEQAQLADKLFLTIADSFNPEPFLGKEPMLKDYFLLLDRRDSFIEVWENFFAKYDTLICPVVPTTATRHDVTEKRIDGELIKENENANPGLFLPFTGHPVVVIPLGRDSQGLPFGVGLVGKRWDDERLLAIAEALEDFTGRFTPPPGYA